jgi:DeoR/GlpR family transcriptional regulator of sugar metabolism
MLTGGTITAGELSLVGDMAEEAFSRLRFDTFVMGIGGVSIESGCTEYSLEDASVKRAALACVRRCIVVAESSKLGKVTFAQVCPLERVDVLVTDSEVTKEYLAALEAEHVEVVVA